MANSVRIVASLDDKVSSGLDRIRGKFDTMGKSKGFQSIVQGVGLGIGIAAWQMASSKIVDALGDAIGAALEEEASIQKLGTALRANVKDWDGNVAAIEGVLAARMKLGFSDDEQRDSLAGLVAATGNVNDALNLQRTAMDLARFKSISLAEASEALTKVEAGSYRILKSLGIELKAGATQTEALAAVQKIAAGQAEDYAETNRGKLLVSQVKVGEAMEKFGGSIMPLAVAAMEVAADKVTELAEAFGYLEDAVAPVVDEAKELGIQFDPNMFSPWELTVGRAVDAFITLKDALGATSDKTRDLDARLLDASENMRGRVGDALAAYQDLVIDVGEDSETMRGRVGTALGEARKDLGKFGVKAGDTARDVEKASRDSADAFETMVDAMKGDVDDLIDKVYDPIITRNQWLANSREQAANRVIIASKKATEEEKRNAREANVVLAAEALKLQVSLMSMGTLSKTEITTLFGNLDKAIATSTGKAKADLIALKAQVVALDKLTITIPISFPSTAPKWLDKYLKFKDFLNFDEGGVVPGPKGAPVPAIVHGGETIIPNDYSLPLMPGRGSGSAAPVTLNITVDGQVLATIVDKHLYRDLRRAAPTAGRV